MVEGVEYRAELTSKSADGLSVAIDFRNTTSDAVEVNFSGCVQVLLLVDHDGGRLRTVWDEERHLGCPDVGFGRVVLSADGTYRHSHSVSFTPTQSAQSAPEPGEYRLAVRLTVGDPAQVIILAAGRVEF